MKLRLFRIGVDVFFSLRFFILDFFFFFSFLSESNRERDGGVGTLLFASGSLHVVQFVGVRGKQKLTFNGGWSGKPRYINGCFVSFQIALLFVHMLLSAGKHCH